jgi:hypothetical protein
MEKLRRVDLWIGERARLKVAGRRPSLRKESCLPSAGQRGVPRIWSGVGKRVFGSWLHAGGVAECRSSASGGAEPAAVRLRLQDTKLGLSHDTVDEPDTMEGRNHDGEHEAIIAW